MGGHLAAPVDMDMFVHGLQAFIRNLERFAFAVDLDEGLGRAAILAGELRDGEFGEVDELADLDNLLFLYPGHAVVGDDDDVGALQQAA